MVLFTAWTGVNALLRSWLVYSIVPAIRNTLLSFKNVKELWDEIILSYANGTRIFQLEQSLSTMRQGYQSITVFYNSFKSL